MKTAGFVILAVSFIAKANQRRNHFKVELEVISGAQLTMNIGSMPHRFKAHLDTKSTNLILMDTGCLNARAEVSCPDYCRIAYCSQLCEKISPNELAIRCGSSYLFNASYSATFEDMRTDVTEGFAGIRTLYGKTAKETVRIVSPKIEKVLPKDQWGIIVAKYYDALNATGMEFVRGLAFDRRYLVRTGGGILGLAPETTAGQRSFIPQLKEIGILDNARLSIQKGTPPLFSSPFATLKGNMMLGALDLYSCHNWKMIPSRRGWEFEMANVRMAGRRIEGRNFGRIAFDSVHTGIPKTLADQLVADGLYLYQPGTGVYLIDKRNTTFYLEFDIGEHSISVGPMRRLVGNPERRYVDESQWTFSTLLLERFCFGYDYEMGAVAWGERRVSML